MFIYSSSFATPMVQQKTLVGILRSDPNVMRKHYRRFPDNVDAFNFARKNMGAENHSGIDLYHKDLRGSSFQRINFERADMKNADMSGVDFEGANLRYARVEDTRIHRTNFRDADLKDCKGLYKVHAYEANFERIGSW